MCTHEKVLLKLVTVKNLTIVIENRKIIIMNYNNYEMMVSAKILFCPVASLLSGIVLCLVWYILIVRLPLFPFRSTI